MENMSQIENCSLFDRQKYVIVTTVGMISGSVSFLACLSAFFIIILFKKWQTFGQRLILYLMISTTLHSLGTVLRLAFSNNNVNTTYRGFCAFAGFASQVEIWMVINTTTAITIYVFLGLVCNKHTEKYEILYILFIFVLPLVFNWIPFINNIYGLAGPWCWIRNVDVNSCERLVFGQALQLGLWYVPVYIILVLWILLYLAILYKLRGNSKRWKGVSTDTDEHRNKMLKSETLYLLVYPIIDFIMNTPFLIARIVGWADPVNPVPAALLYIAIIFFSLQGGVTALAFMLGSDTRQRLRWSHIQAALKNYHSEKGVSEYKVEEVEDSEEVGHYKRVPYKQITDNIVVDKVN